MAREPREGDPKAYELWRAEYLRRILEEIKETGFYPMENLRRKP